MQSDARSTRALEALARPRDAFRSAVVGAVEELTAFLESRRAPVDDLDRRETARLGAFGDDRIDVSRFAQFVDTGTRVGPASVERIQRGLSLLTWHANQGDELFRLRVQEGTDLRDAVRDALALRGRVFSAARHIEMLRNGQPVLDDHDDVLPFRMWRRGERELAPPLVVDVAGADMTVNGLGEYLDGVQKVVLVVHGACAPAPLARLLAPHTFVMQCREPTDLAAFAAYDGPGIAALVPEGCALFAHDPSLGATLPQRLVTTFLPDAPARGVGAGSARTRAEDLAWLKELASFRAPAAAAEMNETAPPAPADQLAAWLLHMGGGGVAR
ncbi:MAG TPA: hypothetical protein VK928_06615 [Longimicrobiales bacterium]|nr:hypothetical protein [Longimicrobiales bacterium]